jgi:pyruvate dehydrogenase E1 component alpha subunit
VVRDAARRAVKRAREEKLPTLLECISYRMRGHSVVDPNRYRPKDEMDQVLAADPVKAFRRQLVDAKLIDEPGLAQLEAEVDREVTDAIDFADSSPDPKPADLFAYTYAAPVPNVFTGFPGDPVTSDE